MVGREGEEGTVHKITRLLFSIQFSIQSSAHSADEEEEEEVSFNVIRWMQYRFGFRKY